MQIVQFGFSPVVDVPLLMQADKTWKEPDVTQLPGIFKRAGTRADQIQQKWQLRSV